LLLTHATEIPLAYFFRFRTFFATGSLEINIFESEMDLFWIKAGCCVAGVETWFCTPPAWHHQQQQGEV